MGRQCGGKSIGVGSDRPRFESQLCPWCKSFNLSELSFPPLRVATPIAQQGYNDYVREFIKSTPQALEHSGC